MLWCSDSASLTNFVTTENLEGLVYSKVPDGVRWYIVARCTLCCKFWYISWQVFSILLLFLNATFMRCVVTDIILHWKWQQCERGFKKEIVQMKHSFGFVVVKVHCAELVAWTIPVSPEVCLKGSYAGPPYAVHCGRRSTTANLVAPGCIAEHTSLYMCKLCTVVNGVSVCKILCTVDSYLIWAECGQNKVSY